MNIALIGMPGVGKSTVGVILAKLVSYEFVDTDILIQTEKGMTLQEIVNNLGYLHLREIEEKIILSLNVQNSIISTGGSVVYSKKAMRYLSDIAKIVFLDAKYETLLNRIDNFESRGLAKKKEQTFLDLYKERTPLYKKYAQYTINCDFITQEYAAKSIVKLVFQ